MQTCYFYLRVAGWVGPPPHLSLFTPGWGCAPLVTSSDTVQGVSLLTALLIARVCCRHPHSIMYITRVCRCHPHSIITRVCRCHPHSIITSVSLPPLLLYSWGVLLPPLLHALYGVCCCHPCFTPGCTQQPLVPFTAKVCVFYLGLHS